MKDITTPEDVKLMVDTFYGVARKDKVLSPFFQNLDFDKHLPRMYYFWEFVLLDKAGYKTDVTKVHQHMRLQKEHFDRWIDIFNNTVDGLFSGETAEKAKQRAFLMRWTMESKL